MTFCADGIVFVQDEVFVQSPRSALVRGSKVVECVEWFGVMRGSGWPAFTKLPVSFTKCASDSGQEWLHREAGRAGLHLSGLSLPQHPQNRKGGCSGRLLVSGDHYRFTELRIYTCFKGIPIRLRLTLNCIQMRVLRTGKAWSNPVYSGRRKRRNE